MNDSVWSWKGQRPLMGWRAVFNPRLPWMQVDWGVLILAAGMVLLGLVFVGQMSVSDETYGRDNINFESHLKKLAVAVPFLILGLGLRPRWLRRNAWLIYGGAMLLLCLVPVLGEERNNARRWIPLPMGFDLQPSELAKIGLIVALARALYRERLNDLPGWFRPALLALLPMGLVAAQPDLGTALTIVPVTLGMCWYAGGRGEVITGLILFGLFFGALAWQFEWVQGYQKKRIDTWAACLDSETLIENKNGAAFHTHKARTSIGNGFLFGTGLGRGVANEAGHLPERDCDSIFAVIAEETGFFGSGLLVLFYLLMSGLLLGAAARTRERFSRLVASGVGLYFASHFFINVSVNLGILPMTGLTLPLISTGGSSLLASFLALGLGVGLSAQHEPTLDLDAFRT